MTYIKKNPAGMYSGWKRKSAMAYAGMILNIAHV